MFLLFGHLYIPFWYLGHLNECGYWFQIWYVTVAQIKSYAKVKTFQVLRILGFSKTMSSNYFSKMREILREHWVFTFTKSKIFYNYAHLEVCKYIFAMFSRFVIISFSSGLFSNITKNLHCHVLTNNVIHGNWLLIGTKQFENTNQIYLHCTPLIWQKVFLPSCWLDSSAHTN